jgi:hypothetical protein
MISLLLSSQKFPLKESKQQQQLLLYKKVDTADRTKDLTTPAPAIPKKARMQQQ